MWNNASSSPMKDEWMWCASGAGDGAFKGPCSVSAKWSPSSSWLSGASTFLRPRESDLVLEGALGCQSVNVWTKVWADLQMDVEKKNKVQTSWGRIGPLSICLVHVQGSAWDNKTYDIVPLFLLSIFHSPLSRPFSPTCCTSIPMSQHPRWSNTNLHPGQVVINS